MPYETKHYKDKNSSTKDILQVDYWYDKQGYPKFVHFHTHYELGEEVMKKDGTDYIILDKDEYTKLAIDLLQFSREGA